MCVHMYTYACTRVHIPMQMRLLWRRVRGGRLLESELTLISRTAIDWLCLIPYTAILIFPLTPPGNVLAFNLLNKYVPGATPSGFTRQRQDCDEMFSEVYQQMDAGGHLNLWGGRA